MDGMNAYRRAQYITLISEMHCLPKMTSGNAIASLAVVNDYHSSLYETSKSDNRNDNSSQLSGSLLSHVLLMCTSIFSLSQCMTIQCHRIFSCALIIAQCWLPAMIDGSVKAN